ncbi:MAG: outer membrane protein assembly factor BamA, partial [Polyangiaceae bacterium]
MVLGLLAIGLIGMTVGFASQAWAQPTPPGAATPPSNIPSTASEADRAEGKPIAEVQIAGNRRISTETIQSALQWLVVGKPFNPQGMTRDVRTLWDRGFFDDVQVDLSTRRGEIRLRILVRERPSVTKITIKGNTNIDDDDLKGIATKEIKLGSIIRHTAIRRTVQKLRDKYAEEGYFLAEADYEIANLKNNEVALTFTIREHEKVTVRRLTFVGNDNIAASELRELMLTGERGMLEKLMRTLTGGGPSFRQDAFERDILIITSHYLDKGFLSAQVAAPRVMLTPDRSGIDITITIDEGPQYKIRRLHVLEVDPDGKEIEPLGGRRKLREMIHARSGDFFNRALLVKDLSRIQTMYRDKGYANVEAPPQTQLYPDLKQVDIIVRVKRRSLVRFGRISIGGNTKTRDKVIRREMVINEGEVFSETGLERSRLRVTQLGYFERVDVSTEVGSDSGKINVNVEVVEKPTGTFQVGAGFSSIESFIATAQVQQANLFGRGQSLALMAQLSGLRQLIDIRFTEPYFFDSRFSMQGNLFDQLRVYNQFALDSTGGSLTVGYPIIYPKLRGSLTYTLKSDEIDTRTTSTIFGTSSAVSVFQRLPLANLFNDGLTSSLRPALTYDTRNNRLFPTSGVYLQGSSEIALSGLGSDNEYVKNKIVSRFYFPLTQKIVLKFNAEAGLVTSPDSEGVPLFARFFLGGIFDLRGYRLRTVGPRLPLRSTLDENAPLITNGANIGGNLSYFQNIEIEVPILDQVGLRGVVFTDLGNTWNLESVYCTAAPSSPNAVTDPCFAPENLFDVRTSWGFGL